MRTRYGSTPPFAARHALGAGVVGGRGSNAIRTVVLAAEGVRVTSVRLRRSVHERRVAYGFAGFLIASARRSGVSGYLGDGSQRWPAVHRRDAATLSRLMLEKGEAGTAVQPVPTEAFGPLGPIFSADQPGSSAWTQQTYGWRPTHPSLLADLAAGDHPA